jgi:signal transduction histidine kinase
MRSNLEEIDRMTQIVEDLLLLSRADNGEIQLAPKEINLSEIVREIVPQAHILAKSKNLHIQTLLPEDQVYVMGDRLRIRELFLNLLENAVKYTEEGGNITIHLSKNHTPSAGDDNGNGLEPGKMGLAEIKVTDTGIGIAKQDQERIFDRFFRVDKARSREQGGSGLGLSICKWIVDAHRGKISVESELGKGSSFIVLLPLHHP